MAAKNSIDIAMQRYAYRQNIATLMQNKLTQFSIKHDAFMRDLEANPSNALKLHIVPTVQLWIDVAHRVLQDEKYKRTFSAEELAEIESLPMYDHKLWYIVERNCPNLQLIRDECLKLIELTKMV